MQRHRQVGFACSYQYVTKLNANLSQILYSTYVTGSWGAAPAAILVDAQRNVVLAGTTYSSDYPTTSNAFQPFYIANAPSPYVCWDCSFPPPASGYMTKLNATGTGLIYSTFLSGTQADTITFAAFTAGGVYLSGQARIPRFSGDGGSPFAVPAASFRDAPQPRRIGHYRRPYRARQRDGLRSGHWHAAGVDWRRPHRFRSGSPTDSHSLHRGCGRLAARDFDCAGRVAVHFWRALCQRHTRPGTWSVLPLLLPASPWTSMESQARCCTSRRSRSTFRRRMKSPAHRWQR